MGIRKKIKVLTPRLFWHAKFIGLFFYVRVSDGLRDDFVHNARTGVSPILFISVTFNYKGDMGPKYASEGDLVGILFGFPLFNYIFIWY